MYVVKVNTVVDGYVQLNESMVEVAFPSNAVASNQVMSFNGGYFTITGDYLSPVSYITVNGFKGSISSMSDSEITYSVPKMVTSNTQATFNIE